MRWLQHRWPVFIWAAVIWGFSTESFGMKETSSFILPALQWFFPHASVPTLTLIHLFIRKLGHITEYFIFSALILHAIRGQSREWNRRMAILAVAIAAAYACTDELHQVFVPGRGPSILDVLLDGAGATLAQLWIARRDRRYQEAWQPKPAEKPGVTLMQ